MYLVVYFNFFQKQEMQKNTLMLGTSVKSSYYLYLFDLVILNDYEVCKIFQQKFFSLGSGFWGEVWWNWFFLAALDQFDCQLWIDAHILLTWNDNPASVGKTEQ